MDPATISLIAGILLKYGPGVAQSVVELFHKPEVTREDWMAVFELAEKSYDEYVNPKPVQEAPPKLTVGS